MDSFYKLFNGEYPDQTPKNTDNEFWGSAWRIKRERDKRMRAGLNEFDRRHNYVNIDFIEL